MRNINKKLMFKNEIYIDIKEREKKRKDLLITLFTYSFCTYLLVYSIIDLFIIYRPIVYLLITCLVSGIVNYILFKKNRVSQDVASLIILTFSVLVFSSLFYFGGIENSGFLWSILFPPMAFFLIGKNRGIVLSFVMLIILIFLYFVLGTKAEYKPKYVIVGFSVYMLSLLFAFFYQYSVEQYIKISERITSYLAKSNEDLNISHKELEKINSINNKIVGIISHDIKANIGSIRSMLSSEKIDYETVNIALSALDSTYGTLENLVDWFKIQNNKDQYKPEQIDINKLIEKTVESLNPFAISKSIKVIKDLNSNSLVIGDTNMISAVLRNLIFNAIKFTPCGKAVKVKTSENGIYVYVSIEDEGKGVPESVINQLNVKGSVATTMGTHGEKGSGLGLLLVKEYLEKHNSVLEISNRENGAHISFNLVKC